MTDPKPLSEEEIQEYDDPAAYDPERLFATVLHYRELIRWLYNNMSNGNRQAVEYAAKNNLTDGNASEILAIVEAGDE